MTTQRVNFAEVKTVLLDRLDQLVRELLPDGTYSSGRKYWLARNPSRADGNAGSFWIYMRGEKTGGWCDAASGQKGDVFGLIQLVRGGTAVQAKEWAMWWTGMDPTMTPAEREKRAIEADARKRQAEAEAAAKLEKDRKTAHAIWLSGVPLALKDGHTPNPDAALAWRYLRDSRGLDLTRLPRIPGCTRLLLEQRHTDSGKVFPALGSCVIGADHKFMALHRVFITDQAEKIDEWGVDGKGQPKKLPVRKTWPDFLGGFIPIWDGGTNLSAARRSAAGHLVPVIVGEGIEDGFAAAIGNPTHCVRAAVSIGNLRNLPVFAGDDSLTVWRDNDWGKPQAEAQLTAAMEELAERCLATGTDLLLASSYLGKDANDLMKGQ